MFYSYLEHFAPTLFVFAPSLFSPTLFVFAPSLFSPILLFCGGGGAGNAVCDACMCECNLWNYKVNFNAMSNEEKRGQNQGIRAFIFLQFPIFMNSSIYIYISYF